MIELGIALFATVGTWMAVTWLLAARPGWRALFCASVMLAAQLILALHVQAFAPCLAGVMAGGAARLLLAQVAARLRRSRFS